MQPANDYMSRQGKSGTKQKCDAAQREEPFSVNQCMKCNGQTCCKMKETVAVARRDEMFGAAVR